MLRPLTPWSSRYLYLWFDSAALPKPAYCRIVHGRPRYMVGWMPRVNGKLPGTPIAEASSSGRSAGVRTMLGSTPVAMGDGNNNCRTDSRLAGSAQPEQAGRLLTLPDRASTMLYSFLKRS